MHLRREENIRSVMKRSRRFRRRTDGHSRSTSLGRFRGMCLPGIPKDHVSWIEIRVNPFTTSLFEPFNVFRLVLEKISSGALLLMVLSKSISDAYKRDWLTRSNALTSSGNSAALPLITHNPPSLSPLGSCETTSEISEKHRRAYNRLTRLTRDWIQNILGRVGD